MNCSRFLPATALLAIFFTGCSSASKPAVTTTTTAKRDGKVFVVSVESAAFFRRGPRAGVNPDSTLSRDTVVKLIRPSFGYSKVEVVATGEQGYVSSEELRPASAALLASVTAPKTDPLTARSTQPPVEQFNLNSNDPRLILPPEDLPPTELPLPAPEQ
ncbi:MAG: hypothetical protein M3N48_07955 [Verrucomicrobiota bacterium]|nr:hypothetical protein [Verrucomicrobiota bacterium]